MNIQRKINEVSEKFKKELWGIGIGGLLHPTVLYNEEYGEADVTLSVKCGVNFSSVDQDIATIVSMINNMCLRSKNNSFYSMREKISFMEEEIVDLRRTLVEFNHSKNSELEYEIINYIEKEI